MNPLRQQASGERRQFFAEGEEQQRGNNVENGVHIGNLGDRVARGDSLHPLGDGQKHAQRRKEQSAKHIEDDVHKSGPPRVDARAQRGEQRRDTGADVHAEEHIDGVVQPQNAAEGQSLQDADGGRGALG